MATTLNPCHYNTRFIMREHSPATLPGASASPGLARSGCIGTRRGTAPTAARATMRTPLSSLATPQHVLEVADLALALPVCAPHASHTLRCPRARARRPGVATALPHRRLPGRRHRGLDACSSRRGPRCHRASRALLCVLRTPIAGSWLPAVMTARTVCLSVPTAAEGASPLHPPAGHPIRWLDVRPSAVRARQTKGSSHGRADQ